MATEYVAGEYGKTLILNAGVDISPAAGATAYAITIERPDGSQVQSPPAPTLGTQAVTVDGVTYAPNQHLLYETRDGDIPANLPGYYAIQIEVLFGDSGRRLSRTRTLEVVD